MRLRLNAFHLLNIGIAITPSATAFSSHSYTNIKRTSSSFCRSAQSTKLNVGDSNDLHQFDYLLKEGGNTVDLPANARQHRRLAILDNGANEQKTILTSSTSLDDFASEIEESYSDQVERPAFTKEFDPFAERTSSQYQSKISESQEGPWKMVEFNFKDLAVTYILPVIFVFWGVKKVSGKALSVFDTKMSAIMESFVDEMVYHDGNFDEMKLCYNSYSRKLMFLGPKKGDIMIKDFLEKYSKKKTVSPQTISSLSYIFSLFKLSEAKTAKVLVELCERMGVERSSSANKIFFLGSCILKTEEAKAALMPIKELIMTTYRDEEVAETLVDTSQIAMAEAAYRVCVQKDYKKRGDKQKKLPSGWEVLGMAKFEATAIFEEEKNKNFVSDREEMYGGQKLQYDDDGNLIKEDGELVNPEDAVETEDDEELEASSNVYSCEGCGYTLFVAEGREFKFFADDFKCPECGCAKDEFKAGLGEDDESDDEE